tara:strand:+ start:2619 stop:2903 length:285 start_codon:yes stop_codon:yes gene_type:complete
MEKNLYTNFLKRQPVQLDPIKEINLGGMPAYIIDYRIGVESGAKYVLGKRSSCPFPDKPFFTIREDLDGAGYSTGYYDLDLKEAIENLILRAGV